jgi:hypothetical protein
MIRTVDNRETPPPDAEGVQEMMKQAMSLILAAGLALAGLPAGAEPPVTTGGGISKTAWILMGAAAVGITTAVVIATTNDNVASPSR